MLFIFLGLYTFFLAIIWGFFIIAKIHSFKFKNFSNHIEKVTFTLAVVLVILSVLGYVSIIIYSGSSNTLEINTDSTDYSEFDNVSY